MIPLTLSPILCWKSPLPYRFRTAGISVTRETAPARQAVLFILVVSPSIVFRVQVLYLLGYIYS